VIRQSLLLLAVAAVAAPCVASAQAPSAKTARAIRVTGAAPRVDGVLDDAVWTQAPVISDFVQKIPVEGATPGDATEVRLLYDDGALYVGARMRRRDPAAIRTSVTRRDGESDSEVFTVSLDTYLDRRTAYSFSVSSGGVRGDVYHSQDSEDSGREAQYDPIWSARARVDAEGWTAELRIPFSQLRFKVTNPDAIGFAVTRTVARANETSTWPLLARSASGYVSSFGELRGLHIAGMKIAQTAASCVARSSAKNAATNGDHVKSTKRVGAPWCCINASH
jgi:hypothetical protein